MYDAFVSYANEDREFVEDYLVPGLEKGDTLSYKCCVHYRDFVVGRQVRSLALFSSVRNCARAAFPILEVLFLA